METPEQRRPSPAPTVVLVAFGLPVPTSLTADANVPYRPHPHSISGGPAAVAVGYKSNHFGRGRHTLLTHNSWGSQWGDNGNGWLPIAFLCSQLAKDFWTLVSEQWLDSGELSQPSVSDSVGKTSGKSS